MFVLTGKARTGISGLTNKPAGDIKYISVFSSIYEGGSKSPWNHLFSTKFNTEEFFIVLENDIVQWTLEDIYYLSRI